MKQLLRIFLFFTLTAQASEFPPQELSAGCLGSIKNSFVSVQNSVGNAVEGIGLLRKKSPEIKLCCDAGGCMCVGACLYKPAIACSHLAPVCCPIATATVITVATIVLAEESSHLIRTQPINKKNQ